MKKTIFTLATLCVAGAVNAQTVNNGKFESYSFTDSAEYESELGKGKNLKLGEVNSWKHEGDISIHLDELGKAPNSSLRIGGAEVDGTNRAYTRISIATAGTDTVSFDSFTIKNSGLTAFAGVFIGDTTVAALVSETFKEESDGAVTAQSVDLKVTKDMIKATGGQFTLGFQNDGGKDSRADVIVDNVSISVPEPSSTALLGLGLAGMLIRRKR